MEWWKEVRSSFIRMRSRVKTKTSKKKLPKHWELSTFMIILNRSMRQISVLLISRSQTTPAVSALIIFMCGCNREKTRYLKLEPEVNGSRRKFKKKLGSS
jgi:hypothetical protein